MNQPKIETLGPLERYELAKIALVVKPGDSIEFDEIGTRTRGKVVEVTNFDSNEIAVKVKVTHKWSINEWEKVSPRESWIDWWHVCRVNNMVVNQQADYPVSRLVSIGDYIEFTYEFTVGIENRGEAKNTDKVKITKLCAGFVKDVSIDGSIDVSNISIIGNKDIRISIIGNEGVNISVPDISIIVEGYAVFRVISKNVTFINNGSETIDVLRGRYVLYELLRNKLKDH